MSTSLAEHVSTLLLRAGYRSDSPELCRIRDHNNRLFARVSLLAAAGREGPGPVPGPGAGVIESAPGRGRRHV